MEIFADLVPHTPGRDRRIANQIRCRPTEGHSDALGWKEPRGEADATDKSQHQLRVKGVDKRRERGSAGEPLRSSRTAVPGTARPGRASDRVRRRRTGAAAGGRGKEKCRGCSGPAACRWAPRAERTPHPRQSPWACARAPHRAARGRNGPSTSLLDQLWTVFTRQTYPVGGCELHFAPKAGRQQQTRCLQQRREWLASRRTTASQRVLSFESRGTCRGDPPERTRGSDLFLPVDDLRRSLASVQARGTRRRRRTKPASAARSRMPDDHDFQGHDAPTGTGFGGPMSWSITGRRVRAI